MDDQPRLVWPVRVDDRGVTGPTGGQAAGPRWRQSSHGRYVPATVDADWPPQRILEQAVRLGPAGAVTGWASLRLQGATYLDGRDGTTRLPVPLVSPDRHLRSTAGSRVSFRPLAVDDRTCVQGIWCTTPERAVVDEVHRRMAGGDLEGAVEVVDMAAFAELTSISRVRAHLSVRRPRFGVDQVLDAVACADESSRSLQETRTRLVWVLLAGLPGPLVNRPVFSLRGRLLGVPDLLDVETGAFVEYDGADHVVRDRRARDLNRLERLEEAGLVGLTVVSAHLHDRPALAARLRAFHHRARSTAPSRPRLWTLVPPPGWRPFPWEVNLDVRLKHREQLLPPSR